MDKTSNQTTSNNLVEKISLGEKIAYGGGDLASNLILVIVGTYATFFYTDALGLNPAIIGSIIFFSRFADGISDVLMGYIMDKTNTKHGKARPWILWCSIPISISTVLVFLVPNIGDVGKYIYVAITYNVVTTFLYTMINIPYGALTSLMSRDQDQRAVINVFRAFMAQVGSLMINALTLPFVNAIGGSTHQRSWVIVSIIYGVLAAIIFLTCFAKTKERVKVSSQQKEKVSFVKAIVLIMKNKYWLMLVGIFLCYALGISTSATVVTYYCKYAIGDENMAGLVLSLMMAPSLVLIPLLTPLLRKFGKRNVGLIGSFFGIAGQLLLFINSTSIPLILFSSVIKGVANATLLGTFFAMVADTIEYGHWHTGMRVEGVLYSATTFAPKLGAGFAVSGVLSILGAAGYDGLLPVQPQAAMDAMRNIFLIIPLVFSIIMSVLYFTYKMDKMYPQIMKDLNEREQKQD